MAAVTEQTDSTPPAAPPSAPTASGRPTRRAAATAAALMSRQTALSFSSTALSFVSPPPTEPAHDDGEPDVKKKPIVKGGAVKEGRRCRGRPPRASVVAENTSPPPALPTTDGAESEGASPPPPLDAETLAQIRQIELLAERKRSDALMRAMRPSAASNTANNDGSSSAAAVPAMFLGGGARKPAVVANPRPPPSDITPVSDRAWYRKLDPSVARSVPGVTSMAATAVSAPWPDRECVHVNRSFETTTASDDTFLRRLSDRFPMREIGVALPLPDIALPSDTTPPPPAGPARLILAPPNTSDADPPTSTDPATSAMLVLASNPTPTPALDPHQLWTAATAPRSHRATVGRVHAKLVGQIARWLQHWDLDTGALAAAAAVRDQQQDAQAADARKRGAKARYKGLEDFIVDDDDDDEDNGSGYRVSGSHDAEWAAGDPWSDQNTAEGDDEGGLVGQGVVARGRHAGATRVRMVVDDSDDDDYQHEPSGRAAAAEPAPKRARTAPRSSDGFDNDDAEVARTNGTSGHLLPESTRGTVARGALVIEGPPGTGKSAVISAAAAAAGYAVVEVHAGMRRSARDIEQLMGELAATHALAVGAHAVLVVEDADVVFDEDRGMWTAVQAVAARSRRPLVITTADRRAVPAEVPVTRTVRVGRLHPNNTVVPYARAVVMAASASAECCSLASVAAVVAEAAVAGDIRAALAQCQWAALLPPLPLPGPVPDLVSGSAPNRDDSLLCTAQLLDGLCQMDRASTVHAYLAAAEPELGPADSPDAQVLPPNHRHCWPTPIQQATETLYHGTFAPRDWILAHPWAQGVTHASSRLLSHRRPPAALFEYVDGPGGAQAAATAATDVWPLVARVAMTDLAETVAMERRFAEAAGRRTRRRMYKPVLHLQLPVDAMESVVRWREGLRSSTNLPK
ncbi:hypothetical protein BC828DRAFT_375335 [Blastocladiella britannica]|nr:hypothetical protein BC828DRAFT_375335 [Blastocladiella britannica]